MANVCPMNKGGNLCLFAVEDEVRGLLCTHKSKVNQEGFGLVREQRICPLALKSNMSTTKGKRRAERLRLTLEKEGRIRDIKSRRA